MSYLVPYLSHIISGGQSGAELGGIEFAIEHNIDHRIDTCTGFVPHYGEDLSRYNVAYLDFKGTMEKKISKTVALNIMASDIVFIYFPISGSVISSAWLARTYLRAPEKLYFVSGVSGNVWGAMSSPIICLPESLSTKRWSRKVYESLIEKYAKSRKRSLVASVVGSREVPAASVRAHLNRMDKEGIRFTSRYLDLS